MKLKEEYFNYIVNNKKLWCHGFTLKKLEKVKDKVLNNPDIMWDLFDRHNLTELPDKEKTKDKFQFDHAIGNFTTSILYTMMDEELIKK